MPAVLNLAVIPEHEIGDSLNWLQRIEVLCGEKIDKRVPPRPRLTSHRLLTQLSSHFPNVRPSSSQRLTSDKSDSQNSLLSSVCHWGAVASFQTFHYRKVLVVGCHLPSLY